MSRFFMFVAGWTVAMMVMASGRPVQAWNFVVVGDTRSSSSSNNNGVNVPIVSELANAIVAEQAAFVLVPGDLVYSGSTSGAFTTWKNAMQPVYDAGIGVYPIRGNHDRESSGYWEAAFAADLPDNGPTGELNRTYALTYNNALILGLDNYVHAHRLNLDWVNQQLAANSLPHVFVMGHDPAFKANHSDCLDDYPADRNAFWAALADAGARAYFAGHDHFYNRARIDDGDGNPHDDLHQYIVGTGGAPFYSGYSYNGSNSPYTPVNQYHEAQYGYVLVEIDGLDVTMTWKHRTAPGQYTATSDIFSYTATLPGDFNLDGAVEQEDLTLLLTHWAATSVPAQWSAPFDGLVDQTELNDLLTNWGTGALPPVPLDANALPEPGTALLVLAGLAVGRRRR